MSKIELNSFLNYRFIGEPKFSPSGEQIAFVVAQADSEDNCYRKQIYLYNLREETCCAFSSQQVDGYFEFDGDSVLLSAKRERKKTAEEQTREKESTFSSDLYRLPLTGGEASYLYTLPFKICRAFRLDDERMVFLGIWQETVSDSKDETDEILKDALAASVQVIDEIPFWSNGGGFTNKQRKRIFLYHEKTGELTPLTDPLTQVSDLDFDPQSGKIVYCGVSYDRMMPLDDCIYILDPLTGQQRAILAGEKFMCSFCGFLDQDYLIVTGSAGETHGLNQDHDIYRVDRRDYSFARLSPEGWDLSLWNSVSSDSRLVGGPAEKIADGRFYFITTEFDHSYLNVIDRDGCIERLTQREGSVDSFDVKGEQIAAVLLRDDRLQDVYLIGNGEEIRLTDLNKEGNALQRVAIERFSFEHDGHELPGYILFPPNYDPNAKYPSILTIHGGPKTAYGTVFFHEMQYFAQAGYCVFFTNPRGSDSRGRKFSDIRGLYGTIDYEDLMAFTDEVIRRYPCVDSQRLGVMGGSYGGYMVNWIIGHTDRFRAACSQRSIANWVSKFGITDIGYFFNGDQQLATPWENFDRLWEKSPLKHAPHAKTPTLFIHSDEDYRCHYSCAMQMHTALTLHGVPSRLVLFHGENHELSRSGKPKERIRRLVEMRDWFARYLQEVAVNATETGK